MNHNWQSHSNYYDNGDKIDYSDSWFSRIIILKLRWNEPTYIENNAYYIMYGDASWSIKYNYGTSSSNKSSLDQFTNLTKIKNDNNNEFENNNRFRTR